MTLPGSTNSASTSTPPKLASNTLETAILRTVAYADVFDYPLTAQEIYHYLIQVPTSIETVQAILNNGRLVPHRLTHYQGYFTLPGRETSIATRRHRARIATQMWPKTVRYGRTITNLPFVRMVAVTGALAVDNVESDADIDYLIITKPGRLWLCRALVILLVKLAARRGDIICSNCFLSERALAFQEHNLYIAHELVQMVPISGLEIYHRMRQLNAWADLLLPNAGHPLWQVSINSPVRRPVPAILEAVLQTPAGAWLERWEMNRKVAKFNRQSIGQSETGFCADWCKGHFDGHGQHTLKAYAERLQLLEFHLN